MTSALPKLRGSRCKHTINLLLCPFTSCGTQYARIHFQEREPISRTSHKAEENVIVVPQITRAGVVLVLLLMNGCGQPPAQQLEAAQKAVDDAKTAEAETYAKDDWMKLEQAFALSKDELAKQETVFPKFRLYDDVGEMLSAVVEYGGHVAAKASQNKEAAKTAALAMEQEALRAVVSAKRQMARALSGKERDAGETIRQQVSALEAGFAVIHGLIENGDYLEAEMQARALTEKGVAVSREIQSATERATGKKPKTHA